MKKKSKLQLILTLIFNLAETTTIALLGTLLNVPFCYTALIIIVFMLTRVAFLFMFSAKIFHFKTWYRCVIWSTLIMLSLFVLLKVDLVVSIGFAIFAGYIMTTQSNLIKRKLDIDTDVTITDVFSSMYLWKAPNTPGKYYDIEEYIKYNEFDTKLLEFEDKLRAKSNVDYLIYKYRFLENKTFNEMKEILGMENPRIDERLERIALAVRLYCGI